MFLKAKSIYQIISLLWSLWPEIKELLGVFESKDKPLNKEARIKIVEKVKPSLQKKVEHAKETKDTSALESMFNDI